MMKFKSSIVSAVIQLSLLNINGSRSPGQHFSFSVVYEGAVFPLLRCKDIRCRLLYWNNQLFGSILKKANLLSRNK